MNTPQFAFYPSSPGSRIPFNSGIHPSGLSKTTKTRKKRNNTENHIARAACNDAHQADKNKNPNWHGIGRHAGVSINKS